MQLRKVELWTTPSLSVQVQAGTPSDTVRDSLVVLTFPDRLIKNVPFDPTVKCASPFWVREPAVDVKVPSSATVVGWAADTRAAHACDCTVRSCGVAVVWHHIAVSAGHKTSANATFLKKRLIGGIESFLLREIVRMGTPISSETSSRGLG
jgi:hypothetical protein